MDDQLWNGDDFVVGERITKTKRTFNKNNLAGPSTSVMSWSTQFLEGSVESDGSPKEIKSKPQPTNQPPLPLATTSVELSRSQKDFAEPSANKPKKINNKEQTSDAKQKPFPRFEGTFSFEKLKTISEHEPLEIYLDLVNHFDQFFNTLIAPIGTPDHNYRTLIVIIEKLCRLAVPETRKYILTESWLKTEFWKELLNYVESMALHEKLHASQRVVSESQLNDLIVTVLNYGNYFIWNMAYGKDFIEFTECLYAKYSAKCEARRSTTIGIALKQLILKARENFEWQYLNDFYPTLTELKMDAQSHPHLETNLAQGRYTDVRHYIDMQLALLKENFILPLRNGIAACITNPEQKRFPNIRVYKDVKFITQKSTNYKYEVILIDLNVPHDNGKQILSRTRELMIGSLLCFTISGKVNDLILGVVSNRNGGLLARGQLQIDILKIYKVTRNIFKQSFLMFEIDIHFEPYHQVYNVLKTMDHDVFPLQKYIVDCETEFELPDCISKQDEVFYKYKKLVFNVNDLAGWPTAAQFHLNDSQFAAFQGALTRKFCCIQGPPGTGKTHTGLKILSALLRNTQLQILIICRTNYMLDQYLMRIQKCTQEIVRMGANSMNPELDQFNVEQLNIESVDIRLRKSAVLIKMEYAHAVGEFKQLQNQLDQCDNEPERKHKIVKDILRVQKRMRSISSRLLDLKQITTYSLVKTKRVIAMTTTYAACSRSLVKMLRAPIVLIEETDDVFESLIIATLTENTQHLIVIGDLQQLRPVTRVHHLAVKYTLDSSLFERMIKNGINCFRLNTQYRQRPEFVNLIRPSIYAELVDHESVLNHPNVTGVAKNLFFIDHTNPESEQDDGHTVKNLFEAQYLIHLCLYLMQQGYHSSEITILTLHPGQLNQLFQTKQTFKSLAKVHCTLVDNFHGRDNKIILLSLVRSNTDGNIGSLAMKNRICVALSRAREGFYMIGNMKLLSGANEMWRTIEEELWRQNAIDQCLPLKIEANGKIVGVSNPREFLKFTKWRK